MYVLYELGILLAVFLGRQRERDRAQEPATPSGD